MVDTLVTTVTWCLYPLSTFESFYSILVYFKFAIGLPLFVVVVVFSLTNFGCCLQNCCLTCISCLQVIQKAYSDMFFSWLNPPTWRISGLVTRASYACSLKALLRKQEFIFHFWLSKLPWNLNTVGTIIRDSLYLFKNLSQCDCKPQCIFRHLTHHGTAQQGEWDREM